MFKFFYKTSFIASSLIVLVSCGGAVNPKPAWVDNPGKNHIGKCGTHINGRIYQEQCAYKKGLAYIAMSKGVTADVSADMNISQSSQGMGSSHGGLEANISMQGKEIQIKGEVIEKWHDHLTDVFYVLIKEN